MDCRVKPGNDNRERPIDLTSVRYPPLPEMRSRCRGGVSGSPCRNRRVHGAPMINPIKAARNGAILELTIDRPKANAFDGATSRALGDALVAYQNDESLRCAIITGAGDRFFSAGWDLKFAADLDSDDSKVDYGPGGFAGLTEMWNLTKPVIAAL